MRFSIPPVSLEALADLWGETQAFLILQLIRGTLVNEVVCLEVEILFWGWGRGRGSQQVLTEEGVREGRSSQNTGPASNEQPCLQLIKRQHFTIT